MELLLVAAFALVFGSVAFFRFHQAIALFLLLLPTYLIRFSIGPLPSTLLEVMFGILFLFWILHEGPRITYHITQMIMQERLLTFSVILFLLSATASLFTSTSLQAALGEWKAFYLEPILFFLILVTSIKTKEHLRLMLSGLLFGGFATSLLALYQSATGWMVPYDFWEKNSSFRVTGWYGFPNGVGLFISPLIPLAGYLIQDRFHQLNQRNREPRDLWFLATCFLFFITGPLALFFAKSTGALVGLGAGIGFLLLLYRKTRVTTGILGILCVLSLLFIPQLSPIKQELLLQDRSGQIRLGIWRETIELLQDHPIQGAGLASYSTSIEPYHKTVNGEGIEIFHHPHNVFLTLWVNIGLSGLISFILLLLWFFKKSIGHPPLIAAAMVILLVHGLVDSPYIKNDLAMLFWVLPALLFLVDDTYDKMEIF